MYPPRNIVRVARRRDATEEQKPSTQALYLEILERLTQQYQPADLLESEAIKDIASALAQLKRARAIESRVFELAFGPVATMAALREFDRLMKYTESLSRQVSRATASLLKTQQSRQRQQKKARTASASMVAASPEEN